MVVVFLADGFEEIEALTPVDILRRAGVTVTLAGVTGREVTGSHGITVKTDLAAEGVDPSELDAMVLPGGLPASPAPLGCVPRRRPDGHLRNGSLKRDVSSDRLRSTGRSVLRRAPGAAAAADKTMAGTPTGELPAVVSFR